MTQPNNVLENRSAYSLIQCIKDGSLDPKSLDKDSRRLCVEILVGEGLTQAQIAQLLKVTDRTVRDDQKAIRARNAVAPSIEMAKEITGELIDKGRQSHAHLIRLARDKEGSVSERAQAEFLAWRVLKELTEKLQTLGYLPLKPESLNITHSINDTDQCFDSFRRQIDEMEAAAQASGILDDNYQRSLALLKTKIEKAEVAEQVEVLKNYAPKEEAA